MKHLLLLLAILLPLQSQAFFWERPEFQEADNLANSPNELIKVRRMEKYRIVDFRLYRDILEIFEGAREIEGDGADVIFASLKKAPMYAYTSNASKSLLAPTPTEVYLKFTDDFSQVCIRRNHSTFIMRVEYKTRCLTLPPSADE